MRTAFKPENAEAAARICHRDAAIETFDEGRYAIVRYEANGLPVAGVYRASLKPLWLLRFRSCERREERIEEAKQTIARSNAWSAARAAEKAKATAEFVNPYKVGDILYNSWGYDQTNVGFYEVVETFGKRGVILRELCQKTVPGSEGFMCERVLPLAGHYAQQAKHDDAGRFVGYIDKEPLRKLVSNDGSVNIYGHDYGYARRWDGKSCYQSHYA